MNDELERIWKEAIMVCFKALTLEKLRKTAKNKAAGLRAERKRSWINLRYYSSIF
jgi:hypothetical protein